MAPARHPVANVECGILIEVYTMKQLPGHAEWGGRGGAQRTFYFAYLRSAVWLTLISYPNLH